MATNLRLRTETELALRREAERTGRSQQDLMREAIDQYLGSAPRPDVLPGSIDDLIAQGKLIPPAMPYRRVEPYLVPGGPSTDELLTLDREDRF